MTTDALDTRFRNPGILREGELELILADHFAGDPSRGWCAAYRFHMILEGQAQRVGNIDLRLGQSPYIQLYAGHIGYGVDLPYRGRRLAARSCRLLLPLAWEHGIDPLWITCNPDNLASRRTCELAGAVYVETLPLPPEIDLYRAGDRFKCRYRLARP